MEDRLPYIVVTDLDGTLLDHHSYSYQAALPALDLLAKLGIPVVLNTSKTYAELLPLIRSLKLEHPFVVENGAAIYWPENYFPFEAQTTVTLGTKRKQILAAIAEHKNCFSPPLQGFADWDVTRLISHTGLDPASAELALQRDYSEPLLWRYDDQQLSVFERQLATHGLTLLKGGRFVHVIGESDKGVAQEWLRSRYQRLWGQPVKVIALGDGANDIAMLEQADYPVLIRSPQNSAPALSAAAQNRCIIPSGTGPIAWNNAIHTLFEQLGLCQADSSSRKEQLHG